MPKTAPKRGPGRPRVPDNARRDTHLSIRLAPDEAARLAADADTAKISKSLWVRRRLGFCA